MRIITIIAFAFFFLLQFAVSASDYYDPADFIFLDELKVGMIGEAHTVIEGSKIETFTVELLGIARDSGFNDKHFLLCKMSGDIIDKSGGIAAGMSGSPVYFSGRLAGAVSGHWGYTNQTIGIVTPIEYMLKELDFVRADQSNADPQMQNQAWIDRQSKTAYTDIQEIEILPYSDSIPSGDKPAFVPSCTPVSICGIEDSDMELIRPLIDQFSDPELINIPMNFPGNVKVEPKLVAGGSVSIPISIGDITMGGYGTVTWVSDDGKYFLGFGHSMGRRGPCRIPAGTGYVYGALRSISRSSKIGVPLEPVAMVYQDRGDAIAGVTGDVPEYIPLKVSTSWMDSEEKITLRSAVIPSWDEYPNALTAVATGSISRSLDGDIDGTLNVQTTVRILLKNEDKWFRRSDVYTGADVLTQYRDDLQQLFIKLRDTDLDMLSLKSVDISADFTPSRIESRIEGMEILNPKEIKKLATENASDSDTTFDVLDDFETYSAPDYVKDEPETVELKTNSKYLAAVKIVNYRAPREVVYVPFFLPDSFEKGKARITARAASGDLPSVNTIGSEIMNYTNNWSNDLKATSGEKQSDLEKYIDELFNARKNNVLIFEIVSDRFSEDREKEKVLLKIEIERNGAIKGVWEIPATVK
jgi:hypothetical protein